MSGVCRSHSVLHTRYSDKFVGELLNVMYRREHAVVLLASVGSQPNSVIARGTSSRSVDTIEHAYLLCVALR